MASIFKQKDVWHIRFYFRGAPYKKSLGAISEHKANRAKQRVEARLADLKGGFLKAPEDADLAEFIVRGEVVPCSEAALANDETFESVRQSYLEYAEARRAPTTLVTETVHLRHFEQCLEQRSDTLIGNIKPGDIERYATQRRRKVTGTTVNKELQTLRQFFDHAMTLGAIEANPTYQVKRFKRSGVDHRFMTKAEMDEQVQRGGLSDKEIKSLHRFRYLMWRAE